MKRLVFICLACFLHLVMTDQVLAQDSFAPAAGQAGTTAIHRDSSVFVSWANGIEVVRGLINISDPSALYNETNYASFGEPENALGTAEGNSVNVVSLGDSGYATLTFENPVMNGNGYDFAVFENSFSDTYLELAFVEVSSDGENYYRFPAVSLTQTESQVGPFSMIDPEDIHNFAGKYRQGYGTPFDLQELSGIAGLDINNITHIRIVDAIGSIGANSSFDSKGNKVNDPFATPFHNGGFDLDGVGVINEKSPVGLTESRTTRRIEVYPNPVSENSVLNIRETNAGSSGTIKIYSLAGHQISSAIFSNQYTLDLKNAGLGKGVYLVKIQAGNDYFTQIIEVN